MKKIIVSTLILSLVVLGVGNYVVDAFGGPGGGFRFDNDIQRPYYNQTQTQTNSVLELSEEQLDQIYEMREEFFTNRVEITEMLQEKRFELRDEILKNESSEKISELEEEIAVLQEKINQTREDYLTQIREILTEEQINILVESESGFALNYGVNNFANQNLNYNRMQYGGSRFDSYQSRSFGGMRGGFRAPVRPACF
ncbi:MAG: Spy/CpxP family protein refolding chaperone [Halanaerobiales bacterium]|nr:Spy/CpxP family protein refolding chaperone [Halanaerobiales bacterium]